MELNLDIFNKLLLETIGVGLIIASDPELEFLFHNQKVLDWFPAFATEGDTLIGEIAGVDKQKLLASLDEKGGFKAAIDVKIKRRVRALSVSVTRASFRVVTYKERKIRRAVYTCHMIHWFWLTCKVTHP